MSQNNYQQQCKNSVENNYKINIEQIEGAQTENVGYIDVPLAGNSTNRKQRQSIISNTASMSSSRKLVHQPNQPYKQWSTSQNENPYRNNALSNNLDQEKNIQEQENKVSSVAERPSFNSIKISYVDRFEDVNNIEYNRQSQISEKQQEIRKEQQYAMKQEEIQNDEEEDADLDGMPCSSRALRKDMAESDGLHQDAKIPALQPNVINAISIKGGRGRMQEGQYLEIDSNFQDFSHKKSQYLSFEATNQEKVQNQQFAVQTSRATKNNLNNKEGMTQSNTQFELATRKSSILYVDQKIQQILKKGKISDIVLPQKDGTHSQTQFEHTKFQENINFKKYESAESLFIDRNSRVPQQFLQESPNQLNEKQGDKQNIIQEQSQNLMNDKTPIKKEHQVKIDQFYSQLPVQKIMMQEYNQNVQRKDSVKYVFQQNQNDNNQVFKKNQSISYNNSSSNEQMFENFSKSIPNYKSNFRNSEQLENTEQKETKAKGERMKNIIEMQMEAEYQNSINKIIEGTLKNSQGATGKSAQLQKSKKFFARDRAFTIKMENSDNPNQFLSEELQKIQDISNIQNGENEIKRMSNSFNLVLNNVRNTGTQKEMESSFFGNERENIDPQQSNSLQVLNNSYQNQKQVKYSSSNQHERSVCNKSFTELAQNDLKIDEMGVSAQNNQDEFDQKKIQYNKMGESYQIAQSQSSQRQKVLGKPPMFINQQAILNTEQNKEDSKFNQLSINQKANLDQESIQNKRNSQSSYNNYSKNNLNFQNNIRQDFEEGKSQYYNVSEFIHKVQNDVQSDKNIENRNCLSQKSGDQKHSQTFQGQIKTTLSQKYFNQMHIYLGTESDNDEHFSNAQKINQISSNIQENQNYNQYDFSGRNYNNSQNPHQILESHEDFLTNRILKNNLKEVNDKQEVQEAGSIISKTSQVYYQSSNLRNEQVPLDVIIGLSDKKKLTNLGYQQIDDEDDQQDEHYNANHENVYIEVNQNYQEHQLETFNSPQKANYGSIKVQMEKDNLQNGFSDDKTQKRLAVISESSQGRFQNKPSLVQTNPASPNFKKQSVLSATSYKSDEVFTNMDEQIATKEEYIK